MSTCFKCGRSIPASAPHIRRRVVTGAYERRNYPGRKVINTQTTYGMRIVCRSCAGFLDRSDLRRTLLGHAELLIALAALIAIMAYNYLVK